LPVLFNITALFCSGRTLPSHYHLPVVLGGTWFWFVTVSFGLLAVALHLRFHIYTTWFLLMPLATLAATDEKEPRRYYADPRYPVLVPDVLV